MNPDNTFICQGFFDGFWNFAVCNLGHFQRKKQVSLFDWNRPSQFRMMAMFAIS